MRRLRLAAPLLATLLLGACASVIAPRGSQQVFQLPPSAPPTLSVAPLPISLAVALPGAEGLLDSPALLVSPQPDQLQVYAGARWAERPAVMLRQRLLRALIDAGLTRAVPADSGVLTRYTLQSDLAEFRLRVDGARATAQIALQVRLLDNASRQLIAQQRFSASAVASSDQAAAAAQAFGTASTTLQNAVAAWTVRQLRAAKATAKPQ